MKKILLLLTLCSAMIACKRNNVEFTYTPEQPKAGETVKFANITTTGQDWEWSFGDGSTSTIKSPSHVYKKPGTYRVILKVDKKKSWTVTKELTVYDTIPTFVCEDSVFTVFWDYTFTANVYNPFNYEVKYQWYTPAQPMFTPQYFVPSDSAETFTKNKLSLYFIRPMEEANIGLRVIMNGDTTNIEKAFKVYDRKTNSVCLRTWTCDYRQRIFESRSEVLIKDTSAALVLDAEQDTMQYYNYHLFTLSDIQTLFPDIEGFHMANRKIYYRADGLWVANIDGSYPVQIDSLYCTAMTLSALDSRIYWANENGVWYMPFIGSDNNKYVSTPVKLNELTDVIKLAADEEPR